MKPILLYTLCSAALVAGCGVNGRETSSNGAPVTNAPAAAATNAAVVGTVPAGTNAPVSEKAAESAATPAKAADSAAPAATPATKPAAPVEVVGTAPSLPTAAPAAAAPPAGPATESVPLPKLPQDLPTLVQEVVRLSQTSVADDVIVAYIERDPAGARLNVDQILLLRDLGVSMKVIQALLRQDPAALAATNAAPVQTVVIQGAPAAPAAGLAPGAPPAATAGQGNVLLTNYLAATAGGLPTGTPAMANAPVAPAAPVYAPGPTPVEAAPAAAVVAPTEAPSTTYFYESLSPYGSWVQVDNYGWCWRPSVAVVNVNWRPYCDDGSWVWTNSGWYWHSNYSWGWGPFHYGRWHRHAHHGWVWYPGTVWGPAWVTWRYSDSYCGWAPLPPEADWDVRFGLCYRGSRVSLSFGWGLGYDYYSCVPMNRFHHREVWRHCLPRERNVTIINNTTIINNYGVDKHGVVNRGIDKGMVERHTREEIRKVDIVDARQPGQASRIVQDGDRVVAVNSFRPKLPSQASAPPARVLSRQEVPRTGDGATPAALPSRPASSSGFAASPATRSTPVVQNPGARPDASGERVRSPRERLPENNLPQTLNSREEITRGNLSRPQTSSPQAPATSRSEPIVRPVGSPSTSRSPNAPSLGGDAPSTGRGEFKKIERPAATRSSYPGESAPAPAPVPAAGGRAVESRPGANYGGGSVSGRPAATQVPAARTDVVRPPTARAETPAGFREALSPRTEAPASRTYGGGSSSGPRSAPAPSYSPPPSVRSAPAPVQVSPRSAPAPSAPPRNEGSSGGRPSRQGREN